MDAPREGRLGAQVKTAPAGNRGLATTNPSKEHFVTTTPQSTPRTCVVDGCDKPRSSNRTLCSMHETRKVRGYDFDKPPRLVGDLAIRFWPKVRSAAADECWEWAASRNNKGYGVIYNGGSLFLAHRAAYELLRADIPDGLEIDHLCCNRGCVNPWHMEPVSSAENARRAVAVREGRVTT